MLEVARGPTHEGDDPSAPARRIGDDRLSADLCRAFPEMKGFSPRNLKYMRAFADAWEEKIVQAPLAPLTWYHNVTLLEKVGGRAERLWYARKAIEHGWSRSILVIQIESGLHERTGKALTNFKATLPPTQSDLARETLKAPYVFDFRFSLASRAAMRLRKLSRRTGYFGEAAHDARGSCRARLRRCGWSARGKQSRNAV